MMTRYRIEILPLIIVAVTFLCMGYLIGSQMPVVAIRGNQMPADTSSELKQSVAALTQGPNRSQEDIGLIIFARENVLVAPDFNLPYNLETSKDADTSQMGQIPAVQDIFNNVIRSNNGRNGEGFFIEVGAHDGESLSNTLWFERNWNWTGLLIETDSKAYAKLCTKNRKAWRANVCLSPRSFAGLFTYFKNKNSDEAYGAGLREISYAGEKIATTMYCVPLYTLLLALNRTVVDFFSLDIEGAELDIIRTIPFDKVHIKVLTVEVEWIPGGNARYRTKSLLNKAGLKLYGQQKPGYDMLFVHKNYLPPAYDEPDLVSGKS